jgi:hypothetical protein
MRLAYVVPCPRLALRRALPACIVALGVTLAGCAPDGSGRNHSQPSQERPSTPPPGDTYPVVKQGGDVPPQPSRLDRADPPLVEAARAGDVKRLRALLDGGADVNAFGNGRTTALMAAAEGGNEEAARLLIERKADANLRNAKGQTAAEIAGAAGRARLRSLLEGTEVKPPPGPANPKPEK